MDPEQYDLHEDMDAMSKRLTALEDRVSMVAQNVQTVTSEFRDHAAMEKVRDAELVTKLDGLLLTMQRMVVAPVRRIVGTDTNWDELTDNVAAVTRVVKMARWLAKMLVAVATGCLTLWGVFHLTQGHGEALPEQGGSSQDAPRGDE